MPNKISAVGRPASGWKTAESVTEGHPDKLCDQISDALLDAYITQDPESRVAMEAFGCHGVIMVGGEVTSKGEVDAEAIAKQVYKDVGYADTPKIWTRIVKQSPDIAQAVDTGGAGDQGIMYGYATNETEEYLPLGVVLSHKLTRGLAQLRKTNPDFAWLGPDGKSQVTLNNNKIKTVLVSTQHSEVINQREIKRRLTEMLIRPLIGDISDVEILVNPTGKFVLGGIHADTGLTGRKIMVDTYGGLIPQGGGCFSGKDPSKVDRSAAYMARHIAKNIVASGQAKECLVSLAYAIGRAEPVMIDVDTFNEQDLSEYVKEKYDLTPRGIIEYLDLRKPIYRDTASYGHFGNPKYSWEKIV
ncbi:methionine adenosyltransferase [Patescibacteria group bacterium]|nr:methionine adenosyltransferase [Patescibacteria group bacterium]MBU4512309.1 methionine adenosyltransferase [Patescibacteria group bacterium]MCG2692760.1 methionine adenosyltransferase [Candidatus Parcubacteria bacterium]